MQKIDSDGATVANRFTEGDVALSVPATVVSADFMNAVQGELVKIVEVLGFTLNTPGSDSEDQVYTALLELAKRGGRVAPISQVLANNQAATDVTDFPQFDLDEVIELEFRYRILRRTDSGYNLESGRYLFSWDSEASAWVITKSSFIGEAGVTFSIAVVAGNNYKLQYATDNLAGASYSGSLKITDLTVIRA